MATIFSATSAFTGTPDFKIIDINPVEVAKALQTYLDRGSKLTGVSISDIDRRIYQGLADQKKATLVQLLDHGMKLFDAMIWLHAGRPDNYPLEVDPSMQKSAIATLHEVARAIFYVYFFQVTQARYPVKGTTQQKPKVPNFLSAIMGMDKDQAYYIELICSFDAQKFDPAWVKSVKFANFGQETLSRFGLGVAGYRMFSPFKLYTPKPDISPELKNAVLFAEGVAKSPPTWSVHPSTRDATILTKRGNLNKNLANLILDVFTDEQIDEMVKAKVIYGKPTREPTQRNYLSWTPEDDVNGTDTIFH